MEKTCDVILDMVTQLNDGKPVKVRINPKLQADDGTYDPLLNRIELPEGALSLPEKALQATILHELGHRHDRWFVGGVWLTYILFSVMMLTVLLGLKILFLIALVIFMLSFSVSTLGREDRADAWARLRMANYDQWKAYKPK